MLKFFFRKATRKEKIVFGLIQNFNESCLPFENIRVANTRQYVSRIPVFSGKSYNKVRGLDPSLSPPVAWHLAGAYWNTVLISPFAPSHLDPFSAFLCPFCIRRLSPGDRIPQAPWPSGFSHSANERQRQEIPGWEVEETGVFTPHLPPS